LTSKIAVIGVGMMGGAIVKSLVKGGYKGRITAADAQEERLIEMNTLGVSATSDNQKAAAESDIIFIVVKPGDVEKVLKGISQELRGKIVVSVAATVPLAFLKKTVPEAKFIRIMPNLAVLVQAAYVAYTCDEEVTQRDKQQVKALLDMMGVSDEIDEKHMDAITGLSGSGPGYLSIIVEALMQAGLKVGLSRDVALKSAAQTVLGTGKLVVDLKEDPAKIRDMVTTPGGTTIAAIYELEGSQVRQALMRAVEEATKKSQLIREKLGMNQQ
jgi:pyrroline-5-carboxylate reductase